MNPKYPIYIVSKGRARRPMTIRALERLGAPFHVVVEPQEEQAYQEVAKGRVLTLPFSNLGQGSIPARNWVWRHSLEQGSDWHWVLDDNISAFYRLVKNSKKVLGDATAFRVIEDFADRFENLAQAGMNYESLVPRKAYTTPIYLNNRIYSCILIRNDLPFRWRGRYNEDTDLSLRCLKGGWCTVLFNAFLAKKMGTMRMKGGNTDELYRQDSKFDGRLEMALSLQRQHPDVVTVSRKWNRYQHHVDYSQFRGNRLRFKPGVTIAKGHDEFGMALEDNK
jgi:hypothetical protein